MSAIEAALCVVCVAQCMVSLFLLSEWSNLRAIQKIHRERHDLHREFIGSVAERVTLLEKRK